MANPEVAFKLVSDGKTVFSSAKTDRKTARIADILGSDFASKLRNAKASLGKFTGLEFTKKYWYFLSLRASSLPVKYMSIDVFP